MCYVVMCNYNIHYYLLSPVATDMNNDNDGGNDKIIFIFCNAKIYLSSTTIFLDFDRSVTLFPSQY